MNQKNFAVEIGETSDPSEKTEMNSEDLEQVSGGLIALLLPAVQKVRESGDPHVWGDPHINGKVQKGK